MSALPDWTHTLTSDSCAVGAPYQVCPIAWSPRPGAVQVTWVIPLGGSLLLTACACEP
jgi:hypothetical protein